VDGVPDREEAEEQDGLFEEQDAGAQEFMAVRPWIGQIAEPNNHNPMDLSKPDVNFALEYVYGYRSADTRQNVKFSPSGKVVYMTAALGVILDTKTNK
jgi:hypothetical protein